ncbi:MAG: hypothetical protein DI585_06595 [Pseudomonas fluorescens]|nr:MAG: hypothetical protein DI585_06595 [Pseudomonas fluorescens]
MPNSFFFAALTEHPDYRAHCEGLVANRLCLIERIEHCDLRDPIAVALMLRFIQTESGVAPVDLLAQVPRAQYGHLLDWSYGRNLPSFEELAHLRRWLVTRYTNEIEAVSAALSSRQKKAL